ncbi:Exoenzymes regulatory protein AepA in lipid-linked oligosaccharide synthesis cluster [Tritonibacter mobilis]|uniref:amidohydrolase n=1 Tax=Tritonibacter mobilis TaxID=379347 RepID=UPI000F6B634B|nr:amidohydrolase [Tritonibacter mobilis]VCU59162.1 Exoenzymes regulatory protein AepA in lipid-linked oligosaccharide synthesis cluster [Tritonibacter mobilis]
MTKAPDTVILNGRLITFDSARPYAEGLAIADGVITAVGSTAEIRALAGPSTRVIDAAGSTVLPGFIDSHVHLFGGSVELACLDLTSIKGEAQLTEVVRDWAKRNTDDQLVFAVQADYAILGDGIKTTRQALDRVLPDRPFAMYAPDHHTVWANTPALEAAGLLHGAEVEAGAQVVMGSDGLASGELQEPSAYAPVLRMTRHAGRDMMGLVTGADPVPPATLAERTLDKAALERGLQHCASHGITGLHNMDGNFYQLELLSEMERDGTLLCRTEVPFHYKSPDPLERFSEAQEMRQRFNSDMVWCNRVKMFMDGVVESGTALMLQPYPGTDHIGDAVFEAEHFNQACIRADAMGLQIATHAIGDLAVRRTLDGYEAARRTNGARDSRHRIEHIEVLHPDDLPRFKDLGVVASIQPGHAPFGGYFPPSGVGAMLHDAQIPLSYAWADIRNSGAKVIFSTDWPVIPVDVMPTIKGAVAPLKLGAPWRDQSQSLLDTLESYTAGNAWVEFNETRKGKLKPGMMADIAVMDHNLETMDPETLNQARAAFTFCAGRMTWQA